MKIAIINGPNLNALGQREKTIYGQETLEILEKQWADYGKKLGLEVISFQSNIEGELLDYIYGTQKEVDGYIINPGAYTHYSYALRDAIAGVDRDFVEVHLSNVDDREEFRRLSVISPVAIGKISGFGKYSYLLALDFYAKKFDGKA